VSTHAEFREVARDVLRDEHAQNALATGTARLREGRLRAWASADDIEALRERGRAIRTATIRDLDRHLDTFAAAVTARGGVIHRTSTAAEAAEAVVGICRTAGARLVGKSKSMATEEIRLIKRSRPRGSRSSRRISANTSCKCAVSTRSTSSYRQSA